MEIDNQINMKIHLRNIISPALKYSAILNFMIAFLLLFIRFYPPLGFGYLIILYTSTFVFLPCLIGLLFIGMSLKLKGRRVNEELNLEIKYLLLFLVSILSYFLHGFFGLIIAGYLV